MKKLVCLLFFCCIVLLGCKKNKVPQLETIPITEITYNSANTGGVITADGGTVVSVRGVCWSNSPNPTIDNDTTINGLGIGTFSSLITGLQQNSIYYVRAYATNGNGTAYGEEFSFNTLFFSGPGNGLVDIDGNTYQSVIIGNQEWMAENLKTTNY